VTAKLALFENNILNCFVRIMNLSYCSWRCLIEVLRRADNCLFLLSCVCSQSSCGRDPIIYVCYGSYPSSRVASSDMLRVVLERNPKYFPFSDCKKYRAGKSGEDHVIKLWLRKLKECFKSILRGSIYTSTEWIICYLSTPYQNNYAPSKQLRPIWATTPYLGNYALSGQLRPTT
jgi:hypothetical protein